MKKRILISIIFVLIISYVLIFLVDLSHKKYVIIGTNNSTIVYYNDKNEINRIVTKEKLNQKYQIVWATGPKQFDIVKEELKKSSIDIEKVQNAKILPYIYNMEEIMNISDIIVARSGAMTITEISNLGKPSILIPLPNVSQDHQLRNAEVLQKIGAAQIILNNELEKDILNKEIIEIASNKVKMKEMGEKASTKSVKNVQEKIYAEIKKIVKGGK